MTNLNIPGLDLPAYMREVGERARAASRALASARTAAKNAALEAIALAIAREEKSLLAANAKDVAAARDTGSDAPFVDRLTLGTSSVAAMAEGVREIAMLTDPVGEITALEFRPSG